MCETEKNMYVPLNDQSIFLRFRKKTDLIIPSIVHIN